MGYRPNFIRVILEDPDTLLIEGVSPDAVNQLAINVSLEQGERVSTAHVVTVTDEWKAFIPVKDPKAGPDFKAGQLATAFGTEIRCQPFTSVSWVQVLPIVDPHAIPPPTP